MGVTATDSTKELLEAHAHVWKHTFNYVTSMSLRCAVQLGIPDIISNHDKPVSLSELVEALSVHHMKSSHVYRLMRILVHSRFFALQCDQDQEGYVLTPSSKLLVKNHKSDISAFMLFLTDPFIVTPFNFMSSWLQGSESSPFEIAHGMNIFDYCSQHSDARTIFNTGMACDTEFVIGVVVKDHKAMFEGFGSLVDVGGGTGTVAKAISEAFPLLRCIVLDLPHVVSDIKGSENLEFVGGDMFESVPPADIVLLKWILHDWSDEDCVKILMRSKQAISSNDRGKVIVIDMVIDENNGNHESTETQLCFDMTMLAVAGGKERTEREWEALFKEAGFTSYKITNGLGLRSIVEVFP